MIDTGIGLLDVADPATRIGQELIDGVGFQFHEHLTAARQIERLGYQTKDVTDIVLNVKSLALALTVDGPKRLTLRAKGPGPVKASDITPVNGVDIMDPHHM